MTKLTIGMATFKDFDGVFFTLQALRLYQDLSDTELLVIDNFGQEDTKNIAMAAGARYVLNTDVVGTSAPRNMVFAEAQGEAVLCCDSHVYFDPGAIARLKSYYDQHPGTRDLLQGPLVYDDLSTISTHFDPVWRDRMWGTWATDPRGVDPNSEPFEIPMQGLGVFSSRKDAWLGFNAEFRGFGGEEGYIHEKYRQAGARTLCLPWLRWNHRFGRPAGVPYPLALQDRLRNYIIGHIELGLDLTPVIEHFSDTFPRETIDDIIESARAAGVSHDGVAAPVFAQPAIARDPVRPAVVSLTIPESIPDTGEDISRAIVCFVDDNPHFIQQALALRLSWIYSQATDTDIVMMGPEQALAKLPGDVVKIIQQPAADDPAWQGYRYINAIACLNGPGADNLEQYSHILRTDCDAFITPGWNAFRPDRFTCGTGGYAFDEDVQQRIPRLAAEQGLTYRGLTNVGMTWYGPTHLVREVAATAEQLTRLLLTRDFAQDEGAWPGRFRGVALKYASEIAINHHLPDAEKSDLLDAPSTSGEPIVRFPHIHCPHTDQKFSKHWFMSGRYTADDLVGIDPSIVRDYCMALSFQSLEPVRGRMLEGVAQ